MSRVVDIVSQMLTEGNLSTKTVSDKSSAVVSFDKLTTSKGLKKVYCITQIPRRLDLILCDLIQSNMWDKSNYPNSEVRFTSKIINSKVRVDTQKFKGRMELDSTLYIQYKKLYDEAINQGKTSVKIKNQGFSQVNVDKRLVDSYEEKYESYKHIESQIREGKKMLYVYIFIEVLSTNKEYIMYTSKLESLMSQLGVEFAPMQNTLTSYIKTYSPLNNVVAKRNYAGVKAILMSDETFIRLQPYGRQGDLYCGPIYLGNCVYNDLIVSISTTTGQGAQNLLVAATNGCGKTAMMDSIINFHKLAGHHVSLSDYKGTDYLKLKGYEGTVVVNLGSEGGHSVQLLDVSYTADGLLESDYKAFYATACQEMKQLLEIILGKELYYKIKSNISTVITEVFRKSGVFEDTVSTYRESKNIKYVDVLEMFNKVRLGSETNRLDMDRAYEEIEPYFSKTGAENRMFKNEQPLRFLLDAKVAVYCMNKTTSSKNNTITDEIALLMKSAVDGRKMIMAKRIGFFFVKVYEEVQMAVKFPTALEEMSMSLSAGRSFNVINYVLLNSATIFKPSKEDDYLYKIGIGAIKSNMSHFIIGSMYSDDRDVICKEFNLDIGELLELVSDSSNKKFDNSFVVSYNGVKKFRTIVKVALNEDQYKSRREDI